MDARGSSLACTVGLPTVGRRTGTWIVYVIFAAVCQLRYYFDGLVHFFTARSRHGTHSPFVYRLVDEVIYGKRQADESADDVMRLIGRLLDRLAPSTVHRLEDGFSVAGPLDFVIADTGGAQAVRNLLDRRPPAFQAGSVLVVSGIYRDRRMKALWRSIKARPAVTV